jgi:hypothetical protein
MELAGQCGLYIDMRPNESAPVAGDWIATAAGSRYLVTSTRLVNRRGNSPSQRYQLRCGRLPKHEPIPADVHVIWLHWYRR